MAPVLQLCHIVHTHIHTLTPICEELRRSPRIQKDHIQIRLVEETKISHTCIQENVHSVAFAAVAGAGGVRGRLQIQ